MQEIIHHFRTRKRNRKTTAKRKTKIKASCTGKKLYKKEKKKSLEQRCISYQEKEYALYQERENCPNNTPSPTLTTNAANTQNNNPGAKSHQQEELGSRRQALDATPRNETQTRATYRRTICKGPTLWGTAASWGERETNESEQSAPARGRTNAECHVLPENVTYKIILSLWTIASRNSKPTSMSANLPGLLCKITHETIFLFPLQILRTRPYLPQPCLQTSWFPPARLIRCWHFARRCCHTATSGLQSLFHTNWLVCSAVCCRTPRLDQGRTPPPPLLQPICCTPPPPHNSCDQAPCHHSRKGEFLFTQRGAFTRSVTH